MDNTSFDFDLILLQKSLKEKSSRSNIENLWIRFCTYNQKDRLENKAVNHNIVNILL